MDDAVSADRHLVFLVAQPLGHDVLVLELSGESGGVRELEFEVRVGFERVDELHEPHQVCALPELVPERAVDNVPALVLARIGEQVDLLQLVLNGDYLGVAAQH